MTSQLYIKPPQEVLRLAEQPRVPVDAGVRGREVEPPQRRRDVIRERLVRDVAER